MIESKPKKEDLSDLSVFLGMGCYRVTFEGQFRECDSTARKIFGIPHRGKDLSNYNIKDLYVVPDERKVRMKRLTDNQGKPLSGTLSVRVKVEKRYMNKLLFDICWRDDSYPDKGNYVGLVANIEDSTIFPKMFDTFPMGLYEIDGNNKVVRVNKKMLEILGYKREEDVLGEDIKKFYEIEEDLNKFISSLKAEKRRYAHDILKLKHANNKTIDVECFTQDINDFELARWGMAVDVTKRERYYRALDRMPTGFYHIKHERVTQCNNHFAKILGFEKIDEAIGIDTRDFFVDMEAKKRYFRDLKKADKRNEALQNYEFEIKKANSGEIATISVDSHVIKDSSGKVIGREGTIRDITQEVRLKKRVKKSEEILEKITADINKLIHTFLHPVLKFSGNSELLHLLSDALYKSIKPKKTPLNSDVNELGKMLISKLIEQKNNLPEINEDILANKIQNSLSEYEKSYHLIVSTLNEKFTEIVNVFDYSLQKEKSKILLGGAIRDAALWILIELNTIGKNKVKPFIKEEFIELVQDILFSYLIQAAKILESETQIMKRNVEALRAYIGLQKQRNYTFIERDIGAILEENIELFKPILLEEDIKIEYNCIGNLKAEISPNDIDRVICNLFHNARKYSFRGKRRFVKVEAKELTHKNKIEFSIESFGIPIMQEEIESGDIWRFGYRGELAINTDRDGTGVGLADSKDVIEAHGGQIFLSSIAASDETEPPEYKVPYLTKVTIRLPKTVNRGGENEN